MHQPFLYAVVCFNLYRITTLNISTNKTNFIYLFIILESQPSFWNDQEGCSLPAIYTDTQCTFSLIGGFLVISAWGKWCYCSI